MATPMSSPALQSQSALAMVEAQTATEVTKVETNVNDSIIATHYISLGYSGFFRSCMRLLFAAYTELYKHFFSITFSLPHHRQHRRRVSRRQCCNCSEGVSVMLDLTRTRLILGPAAHSPSPSPSPSPSTSPSPSSAGLTMAQVAHLRHG